MYLKKNITIYEGLDEGKGWGFFLTLCMLGYLYAVLSPNDFFKVNLYKIFFQEYHQCQKIWIQIRQDVLSGLIWVQAVCKSYQQITPAGKGLISVKTYFTIFFLLIFFYFFFFFENLFFLF